MKGQGMALETIFKVLIMLVVVAVVIGLVFTFSTQIKTGISNFMCDLTHCKEKKIGVENIEQRGFTAKEIANYIDSCISTQESLPESEQKDTVCYLLISTSVPPQYDADEYSVLENLPESLKDKVSITTDFDRSPVIIEYKDLGNKVLVR